MEDGENMSDRREEGVTKRKMVRTGLIIEKEMRRSDER